MLKRTLLAKIDRERIKHAIGAAEKCTSGEIRVCVAPFFWGNVQKTASKAFQRLGMDRTELRNGILFFIVPSRRRFAILGDLGIHEKVGQAFWETLRDVMSSHFHSGDFTTGLEKGIASAGEQLRQHFPHAGAADRNELPDDVADFKRI